MNNNSIRRYYATIYFRNFLSTSEQAILELALEKGIIALKKSETCYRYTFEASSEESLNEFLDELHSNGYDFLVRTYSK